MADFRMIVRTHGGPETIEREDITPAEPGAGEVRIRQGAIGLNFIDTYHRTGLYPADLPSGLGTEAAGVIEAVGAGVDELKPGDRVAYVSRKPGAYATVRTLAADEVVAIPGGIGERDAAAALLKGMTAAFLVEPCAGVRAGEVALVHAAAGGVGSILVQWLKAVGAIVVAHAGSAAKADAAKAHGADHALSCPMDELAAHLRDLTGGHGARVVFDGVGKASWEASLGAIARRGLIVTYGNASGPVPPFDALALSRAGSIFVTRPTLFDYIHTRAERVALAGRLFAMMQAGKVTVPIGQTFALEQAADAHRALESRATTGATLLLP